MLGEEEPCDSCIVVFRANVAVILHRQEIRKTVLLMDPNLEREAAAGTQMSGRGGDEFANQFVALWPAIKRDGWIVSQLGRKLHGFACGDVGEVGDDQVEGAFNRIEQMALPKVNTVGKAK